MKTTVQNGVAAAGHSTQKTMRRPCEVISNDHPSPGSYGGVPSAWNGQDKKGRLRAKTAIRSARFTSFPQHATLLQVLRKWRDFCEWGEPQRITNHQVFLRKMS